MLSLSLNAGGLKVTWKSGDGERGEKWVGWRWGILSSPAPPLSLREKTRWAGQPQGQPPPTPLSLYCHWVSSLPGPHAHASTWEMPRVVGPRKLGPVVHGNHLGRAPSECSKP